MRSFCLYAFLSLGANTQSVVASTTHDEKTELSIESQGVRAIAVDGATRIAFFPPRHEGSCARSHAVEVRTTGWMLDDARQRAEFAAPVADAAHFARSSGDLTEWMQACPTGIEHGWVVHRAEASTGARLVRITMQCTGLRPVVLESARDAVFVDEGGEVRLRYSGLHAYDAQETECATVFSATAHELVVSVEVVGAVFPIHVDPIFTGPVWTFAEPDFQNAYTFEITGAGDIDADGFADVVCGAPGYGTQPDHVGRAYAFRGGPFGPNGSPDWTATGTQANAEFGFTMCGAGDINADGFLDVAIGSPGYVAGVPPTVGKVDLFFGGSSFLGSVPGSTITPPAGGSPVGASLAPAGDVDGDGYADLLTGSPYQSNGRAYVFRGSPSGLLPTPTWQTTSATPGAAHGTALTSAGDTNLDGWLDVAVSAPGDYEVINTPKGRVRLYLGGPGGMSTTPAWTGSAEVLNSGYGATLAGAGDANGDGASDLLIAAPGHLGGASSSLWMGKVWLHLGTPVGLVTPADWTAHGDAYPSSFGQSIVWIGDIDGDLFGDWCVGAPFDSQTAPAAGRLRLFHGGTTAASMLADWETEGSAKDAALGTSMAFAGDIDGDGDPDLLALESFGFSLYVPALARAYLGGWGCGAAGPSSEIVRVGAPPNPVVFNPSSGFGPELGRLWSPSVDHTVFAPFAIKDVLAVAPLQANISTSMGTLLIDVSSPPALFMATAGSPFLIQVPGDCALLGKALSTQVASIDLFLVVRLTNALDLIIGSY